MNDWLLTGRKRLLKCQYLYIGKTKTRGFGVFAARKFKIDTIVVIDEDGDYFDQSYSRLELESMGIDIVKHAFQIDYDRFLLPNSNIDDFINHSCDPNCGIELTRLGYKLVALHGINKGDEITYDYSTYMFDDTDSFRCMCGTSNCRKIIKGFNSLSKNKKDFYCNRKLAAPSFLVRYF